jgi:hypothetical protein
VDYGSGEGAGYERGRDPEKMLLARHSTTSNEDQSRSIIRPHLDTPEVIIEYDIDL